MRENCTYGSEGGRGAKAPSLPGVIQGAVCRSQPNNFNFTNNGNIEVTG